MIWLILILATILRLIKLDQSLWLDEATQAILSQKSMYSIWFERMGDFHPPLSYIFYHFWIQFGTSEIWLRLLPVIFGISTVFVIYKLCQKLFSEKIALISALLFATAPYHIYYSQEIRMYSMATFFASLSVYFLVTNKKIGYVLAGAALLYTHYMGVFLLIAQLLYKRNWQSLGLMISLTYIPWLPYLWNQLVNGVSANQYLPGWSSLLSLNPIKAIPLTFLKFSIGRINFEPPILYGIISALILGFLGFLISRTKKSKDITLVLLWLLIPVSLTWVVSFILPMDQPFRLLFVLPAFYILLAIGISELERFWRLGLLGVLCISISGLLIYWTNPKFQREDWRGAVNFINQSVNDDGAVIFSWPEPFSPYEWYKGKEGIGVVKHFPAKEDDISKNMELVNYKKEVYFFEYLQALSIPEKNVNQWLDKNGFILKETFNFNGVGFVYLYVKHD